MGQTAVEAAVSGIDYTIGENVDTLRRRAGLSNEALGQRFGLSASAMSLKLRGKRSWSAVDIQAASRLFGVRWAQLVGEDSMPDPTSPATITDISDVIARKRMVGPAGIEPTTSTVEYERLADVIQLFGTAATEVA